MKKIFWLLCILCVGISSQTQAQSGVQKKKANVRQPTQDLTAQYIDEALQSPHNCRVIIRYHYRSDAEKIEIMPFIVKTELECKETAKLFEPILDDRIKTKKVTYLWLKSFLQK